MEELSRPAPGRRKAVAAFLLACLGPFVMACSSPAAIVLGFRSLGESAAAGARAPGRVTAYGAIVAGALGLWFWGWVVAQLAGELSERGKDPAMVIPLVGGLAVVWVASALAGWLTGRGTPTPPLG
ncbi:MAG TPA: hypothetical protein VG993_14075 [Actinomycetota bacterium]|nr:hypothetical protein [Actinomycetota bacterium]